MTGLKGDTAPRIFTPPLPENCNPDGPTWFDDIGFETELMPETTKGFQAILFAKNVLGLELRPWQKWVLLHGLELDPESGRTDFRFRTVVLEVGRQNGKTLVMIVLGLWRMFIEGASEILSAAQSLAVAQGTVEQAFSMVKNHPLCTEYLPFRNVRGKYVPWMPTANGAVAIELETQPEWTRHYLDVGAIPTHWYVLSTEHGGGRSYSANLVLLDELREHKKFDAWDAIVPTSIETKNSQVWCFSNAGDATAVVLRKQRNIALHAINRKRTDEARHGLFSYSAPAECSIFDPAGWAAANPSLGYGNRTERDMLAMAQAAVDPTDTDSSEAGFRTEYLCQWVETVEIGRIVPADWTVARDPESRRADGADVAVGIDVSADGKVSHIGIASTRADGNRHIEVIESRPGVDWVVEWLESRNDADWFDGRVAVQARGAPASALIDPLEAAGIEVVPWEGPALSKACGALFNALVERRLRHRGQPLLDGAASGAKDRKLGDAWIWDRHNSHPDVTPIVAVTAALWLLDQPKPEQFRSAYEDSEPIFI